MNLVSKYETTQFLFFLTLVQFWWIAVWGLAYIVIEQIAGTSKNVEVFIYVIMMLITAIVLRANPEIMAFL
jgi:hypothetical protein